MIIRLPNSIYVSHALVASWPNSPFCDSCTHFSSSRARFQLRPLTYNVGNIWTKFELLDSDLNRMSKFPLNLDWPISFKNFAAFCIGILPPLPIVPGVNCCMCQWMKQIAILSLSAAECPIICPSCTEVTCGWWYACKTSQLCSCTSLYVNVAHHHQQNSSKPVAQSLCTKPQILFFAWKFKLQRSLRKIACSFVVALPIVVADCVSGDSTSDSCKGWVT